MNPKLTQNAVLMTVGALCLLLAVMVVSYWTLLQKINIRWSNDDNTYCYLLFPVFAYLLWDRRQRFKFDEFAWHPLGLALLAASILIIFTGELLSVETLLYIGLWACIASIMFVLYGPRIRQLAFPLAILAFIVPLPPYVNRLLTFELKLAASSLATFMLRHSGVSVYQDGNIIDLGVTQLQIVEACSGLRYLMPLFLLVLLIGYFYTRGWWRKSVMVAVMVPLSVFLNSLRIWLSGILSVKGHPELVENFFHDFSGWVLFMIAGAIMFGVTRLLNRIGHIQKGTGNLDIGETRLFNWRRPLALTTLAGLMFIASGYGLHKIPSAAELPARLTFTAFPDAIGQWEGRRSFIPPEVMDQFWADDYVEAAFVNPHHGNTIHLLIPFYEWQGTRHTIHAPQSCLLGSGWALTGSRERVVSVGAGRRIPVMTMTLEKGNIKVLGSYFFFQRGRVLTSPWMSKAYLMWDAFTRRRTDGALVRAELAMVKGQSIDDAWEKLEGFITELWPVLPRFVPE